MSLACTLTTTRQSYPTIYIHVLNGTLSQHVFTSEMIHHHGVSLSKQQTADLLMCHGTQQDLSL